MEQNQVTEEQVISVIFTLTPDLNAAFPAAAARRMGLTDAGLLCTRELSVPGSEPRLLRVLVHAELDRPQSEVRHVYLGRAQSLRPDLREHEQP